MLSLLTPLFPNNRPIGSDEVRTVTPEASSLAQRYKLVMINKLEPKSQWVFPLTESSFQEITGMASPIVEVIKATFPIGFVPEQKAKHVRFRFENEDGSFWGGEDINVMARFNEFFEWKWADPKSGLAQPTRWHRPAWLTFRAWQIVRSQVSRRTWDAVSPSDLTIEILQARKDYFDKGMYQEHGFPVRLVLTLE